MEKIKAVTYESVLAVFDNEHNLKIGSNSWARKALSAANSKFQNKWGLFVLNKDEILNICLPHHVGEHGQVELIPKSGMTVAQTTDRLKSLSDYSLTNPKCWEKIEYLKSIPFSPVFLSKGKIDWEDYKKIIAPSDGLFHLDGLHRLVTWVSNDRVDSSDGLEAYIAGLM